MLVIVVPSEDLVLDLGRKHGRNNAKGRILGTFLSLCHKTVVD